ncbi:MAG: response regulator transcription factor [Bacteroidota bacterium]
MSVRILIYEDNEKLRDSLVSLLSDEDRFTIVGDFPKCTAVKEHIEKFFPDVVLMDIDLPEMNGIEGVKHIREIDKVVCILMITVFDDNTSVFEALYAGANGYLLKKYIFEKLAGAIKDMLEGGAPMSPVIARMVIDKMVTNTSGKKREEYRLTSREMDVLTSLAKGNSYKMIADDLIISIETVRWHIKNVYSKLHVQSQGEAISKALREGLIK